MGREIRIMKRTDAYALPMEGRIVARAFHCESLSGARLPVSKHRTVVSGENFVEERTDNSAVHIDLQKQDVKSGIFLPQRVHRFSKSTRVYLFRFGSEDSVESEFFRCLVLRPLPDDNLFAGCGVHDGRRLARSFCIVSRPVSSEIKIFNTTNSDCCMR